MRTPRTLALIPARGGSKGLPGKNVRLLAGKPLLAWTVEQARATPEVARVIVSTDDRAIAEIARRWGAETPFFRPPELSGDAAPTTDAVLHALDFLEAAGDVYEALLLLEPTSPLRAPDDLSRAIRLLAERWEEADAVVSAGEIHTESPFVAKTVTADGFLSPLLPPTGAVRRQELPVAYFPYGVAYLVKVSAFRERPTFYQPRTVALPVGRWQNFEVDDAVDLICVEAVLRARLAGEL